ncbi:MAG: serine hydrolase, partial [Ginsengibacter sp.]
DFVKSYGYRNKTKKLWNDTATCFYAASLSKPVFAYLVMQLVDKGLINLDTPVYKYLPKPLPEYENYKDLAGDDRWKLITPRQCLSHTTGFPNWRQLNPKGNKKLEIFFTPGTRYAYSGEGIYLLQFIVETITNQKLDDLASKQIFKPFGMTKTSFVWQNYFDTNYAVGHNQDEETTEIKKRIEANAAGSMETTIADYTRFISYVMQGKRLSNQSKHEMLSPQIGIFTKHEFPSLNDDTTNQYKEIELSYGLGWGLFKSVYGWAFFKEGHSDDGWQHYIIGFPDKKNALIIMTNSSNGESIFKELVEYFTGATIPWEWEGYIPYQPIVKVPVKILKQYTGDYDGRTQARISLENGQLKIESKKEALPKTNLYAKDETHFFMKPMPDTIEFIKNADGEIEKIKVNDEGEIYELNKVCNNISVQTAELKLPKDILISYVGKYALTSKPKKTLVIEFKDDYLIAKLPGQESLQLIFLTNTAIEFKSILDIKGEFIMENGKVTKLIIDQNGKYEWQKTQ